MLSKSYQRMNLKFLATFFLAILFFLSDASAASMYTYNNEKFYYGFEIEEGRKDTIYSLSDNVTKAQVGDKCVVVVSVSDIYSSLALDSKINAASTSRSTINQKNALFKNTWNNVPYVKKYFVSTLKNSQTKFSLSDVESIDLSGEKWFCATFTDKKQSCGKMYIGLYNGYLYYLRIECLDKDIKPFLKTIESFEKSFYIKYDKTEDKKTDSISDNTPQQDVKKNKYFYIGILVLFAILVTTFVSLFIRKHKKKNIHKDI